MKVFAIIGWPLKRTLSPQMQTAAFAARQIDASYVSFAVEPNELATAVAGIRALGITGFNVTQPHKETIVPLLDELDPAAAQIGAVNTVVASPTGLVGHNTDAAGLVRALRAAGVNPAQRACVLGAGGAARAAVFALQQAGATAIAVYARRATQAEGLARDLGQPTKPIDWGPLAGVQLGDVDIVIQASSGLLSDLPVAQLHESSAVLDMVYTPLRTPLLKQAAARGLKTIDGLEMLLHQGAIAFEAWTGNTAPLNAMRNALRESQA